MFDMGFFELLLIAIVSLLVIGPERLPDAVRSVSLWVGRIKRSLRETRSEIERQIGADDIRRQLHNEQVMRNLEATRQELNDVQTEVESILEPERERRMNANHYDEPDELPDHAHASESPAQAASTTDTAADTTAPDKT